MRKLTTILLSLLMAFTLCLSVSAEDDATNNDPTTQATSVAKVDDTEYATLQEAINAGEGKTVVLTSNVDISNTRLSIGTNTTLDLNGYVIKAANSQNGCITINDSSFTLKDSSDVNKDGTGSGKIYTETPYGAGFDKVIVNVNNGATFTMESGLIDAASFTNDNANKGHFAVGFPDTYTKEATVIINGGHIKAGWYAVAGNGQNGTGADQNIIVNGGILESTSDYAIYHCQKGTTTINGGVVYGAAGGILLNRGSLVVNGGTITSKGVGDTGSWGDGTGGASNAAIHLNTRYGDVNAEVKGGNVSAEGDAVLVEVKNNHTATLTVSGGTFSSDVSKYLVEGNNVAKIGEKFIVVKDGGKAPVTEKVTPAVDEEVFNKVSNGNPDLPLTSVYIKSEEINLQDNEEDMVKDTINNDSSLKGKDVGYIPLDLKLIAEMAGETLMVDRLDHDITVTLYLDDATVAKLQGKIVKVVRIHYNDDHIPQIDLLDATLVGNALKFDTNLFSTYVVVYDATVTPTIPTTPSTDNKSYDPKDKNHDGIISCDEEMNSANWVWSENKKACVYKVTNTSVR